MCDDNAITQPDAEDNLNPEESHKSSQEIELVVGSFDQVTAGLAIRYAEEEDFDVSSMLARADAAIPGAAAIADAVNQYGYAIVRFPEGKCWNDLMPRNTPGYEGWSHFATYAENGGVDGGNAAIKQAGLQPAAIANLAMQGAAMALGLAYMARIDNKLGEISKGIDEILRYMEEDYVSRLEGHAIALTEYGECFEEYAGSTEERTSVITNTQRIYEKLRGYWRKELRRLANLQTKLRSQGKSVMESDARRLLSEYKGIDDRMRYIFGLAVISRQVLLQYSPNYKRSRIARERKIVYTMRDEYLSSRESIIQGFESLARGIKAPLGETMPRALLNNMRPKELKLGLYGLMVGSPIAAGIGAAVGVGAYAARVSDGIDEDNSNRQSQFRQDVSRVADYIENVATEYGRELDNIEFRFNRANAILIGPESLCPLEIVGTKTTETGGDDDGEEGDNLIVETC